MNVQLLFSEAVHYHQQGRLEEALNRYQQLIEVLPENANLLGNIGIVHRDLGRPEQGLAYCRQAMQHRPGDPNQLVNLGACYESLGRTEEALATYERAHTLAPTNPKVLNNLGKLCHLHGKTDQALVLLQRSLEIEPGNPLALNNLGVVLSDAGHTAEAAACLEHSLQLQPHNCDILYNLSGLYNCQGKFDQARHTLEKLLKLQPDHAAARHMLAAVCGTDTDSAPAPYITETFDKYAHRFESHTRGSLGYTVPAALAALIESRWPDRQFDHGLDLGCGTGLVGDSLREQVNRFTGIDLSPNMLAIAEQKKCYNDLICTDLADFLKNTATVYDLFVAADVFIYLGKLEGVIASLADRAAQRAVFACSIERLLSPGREYALCRSGRFAHAPDYVKRCADEQGFVLREHRPHDIRKEHGVWIQGDLLVFERSAPRST